MRMAVPLTANRRMQNKAVCWTVVDLWIGACFAMLSVANAISNPPYEVYPYVADSGDSPPLNYMKVCEPGRTGEANASYVVLGISFPRTYPAVSGTYSGDLVIPPSLGGLPVRKIKEEAFLACTKLRSVTIPATVREIGERAFSDCYQLTNVTFASGVTSVGDGAFSNCVALTAIRFPKTLARLGAACFQGCIALTNVYFEGNAPRLSVASATDKSVLGESIFRTSGYGERFKIHINRNTYGWIAPYEKGAPEKWPVEFGYMQAHETVAETGGETSGEESGFVTVVTEVRGGTVAVPESWAQRYPYYAACFGTDFATSLHQPTGKKDAAGDEMFVWQDYVAGTDPTDIADRFTATIRMEGETPVVEWSPKLSEAEAARRRYTIYGKTRLSDAQWREIQPSEAKDFNFFKVSVEMR